MVIKYSREELYNLRDMLVTRETLQLMLQGHKETRNAIHGHMQLLGHPIHFGQSAESTDEAQPVELSPAVADFFKKAQQNFHVQTGVDPTKIRRLSEVEAELVNEGTEANEL